MAARSLWKGSISFGLVNIPIRLYSATDDRDFSFNQLCENGHRIQYKRWCPIEEREVAYDEIKKGYEVAKDNYIVIDKEELKQINIKTTKTIDIKEFVTEAELDPIFVEKSYYVAADNKSGIDKAYSLFVAILKKTGKVAIGKVVIRDKEQLVALRAYQRGIVLHVLHFIDEIKPMDEIKEIAANASAKINLDEQELELGKTLVGQLTSDELDISKYYDAYTKRLEQLIQAKTKGKEMIIAAQPESEESTKDLLAALKASINSKGGKSGKRR
jgi:DNA end-binding protein Ku